MLKHTTMPAALAEVYGLQEVEELDEQRIRSIVRRGLDQWLEEQNAKQPTERWQIDGLAGAVASRVTGGGRPMGICTRLESAMMAAKSKEG